MDTLARRERALGATNWNTLAELDPLWTILTDPRKKFGKWDPVEFFTTGDLEAERVLAMCKAHDISISYGKLLDFGCGVGRVTRAFSHYFESCIGIDVSEKMIGLAREFNSAHPRCEFIASEAGVLPFADKSFDFVLTVLVLQHLPNRSAILETITEFLRVAKDNGVIVFQLPSEVPLRNRFQPRRRLWSLLASVGVPRTFLYKRLGLAPMQMNCIPREEIETFMRGRGGQIKAVETYDPADCIYHSNYYFVVKQPRWPSIGSLRYETD